MKRTKAQEAFDLAKHGWAFCNHAMLEGKVVQCAELLPPGDAKRKATLDTMRAALARHVNQHQNRT